MKKDMWMSDQFPSDDAVNVDDVLMCRKSYQELTRLMAALRRDIVGASRRAAGLEGAPGDMLGNGLFYTQIHVADALLGDLEMFCDYCADGAPMDDALVPLFTALEDHDEDLMPNPGPWCERALRKIHVESTAGLNGAANDDARRQVFAREFATVLGQARAYLRASGLSALADLPVFQWVGDALNRAAANPTAPLDVGAPTAPSPTPEDYVVQAAALWFEQHYKQAESGLLALPQTADPHTAQFLDAYANHALSFYQFCINSRASGQIYEFFRVAGMEEDQPGTQEVSVNHALRILLGEAVDCQYGAEKYEPPTYDEALHLAHPQSLIAMKALIAAFERDFPDEHAAPVVLPDQMAVKMHDKRAAPPFPPRL